MDETPEEAPELTNTTSLPMGLWWGCLVRTGRGFTVGIGCDPPASRSRVDVCPSFGDIVSMPPTLLSSLSFADGKVRPDIELPPIINDPLSPGPGEKPGGGGKAGGDGAVDTDDLSSEITREPFSSGLERERGGLKKPRIGDRYDGKRPVVLSMKKIGGASSGSAGDRKVSCGDSCNRTSRRE